MKRSLTILFIIIGAASYSQNLEAYGGLNLNSFHDFYDNGGNYSASFESGSGPVFGIGIDSVRLDLLKFSFALQYEMYSGELEAYEGGHMYSHIIEAEIKKSTLSLEIFPLCFTIIKRIDLDFGVQLSVLLAESFEGKESGWSATNGSYEYNLQEKYDSYSSVFYCGLVGRIAYDFKLSESYFISPQYSFYYGLTKEFIEFPEDTKSMRHYFCIGVEKRLR